MLENNNKNIIMNKKVVHYYHHHLLLLQQQQWTTFAMQNKNLKNENVNKLKKFGFLDWVDSETMFLGLFEEMRAARLIP